MDSDSISSIPRVNFELLQRHIGQRVRLVCKLERIENNSAVVSASDGGTVYIEPSGKSTYDGQYAEIEGIVKNPNTLQELEVTSFGDAEFDMATYNELVKLANGPQSHLFK